MKTSFYSDEELRLIGFKSFGKEVFISRFARFYYPESIEIGHNVRIDDFCILSGKIKLGNYIHISAYTVLYGKYGIEMEDYTGFSPRCSVFSANDDFSGDYMISPMVPKQYTNITGGQVCLKRYTQVGAGSIIMPGVTLHEGVAVGAMSLVKKDLEAWGIYAGNPILFIKPRKKGLLNFYGKFPDKK